jgi:hypothetical protein
MKLDAGSAHLLFDPPARRRYADPVNRPPLAILPLFLAAGSCTVIVSPGESQCQKTADCTARGFAGAVCVDQVCEKPVVVVDPVWGCLGHVVEPVPDPTKKVDLSVNLTFTDQSPVTMATVDVCDKLDVGCTGTNPDFPKGLSPDANGRVGLSVIQGFDGFVRVTGPQIIDSRVFVGRPIITPPSVKAVRLLQPSEYDILAAFAKQTVDPTRGTAILLAVDCKGLAVGGVHFETPNADAMSQEFYLINQAPTTPPTATATDVDGFGGFFNLPVGAAVGRPPPAHAKGAQRQ